MLSTQHNWSNIGYKGLTTIGEVSFDNQTYKLWLSNVWDVYVFHNLSKVETQIKSKSVCIYYYKHLHDKPASMR